VNGAESDYYLSLSQPYAAKDGPFDDLSELLLVRSVSPEIYWGPNGVNRAAQIGTAAAPVSVSNFDQVFSYGLVDLFDTLGRLQININTASPECFSFCLVLTGIWRRDRQTARRFGRSRWHRR